MPDIDLICPDCATVTTLSEFVDEAKLCCRACGKHIGKPGPLASAIAKHKSAEMTAAPPTPPAPTTPPGLRLAKRKHEYTTPPAEGESVLETIATATPAHKQADQNLELRPKVEENKSRVNHALIATVLFLVLGGGMGYLRYGEVLGSDILGMAAEYSWFVFLAFHAMVVIKAMTDNMLQGILCLLVPGYSLFYLFNISDDFYLRAILAGLLVGIGEDTAAKLTEHASTISGVVRGFIAGGGGKIR